VTSMTQCGDTLLLWMWRLLRSPSTERSRACFAWMYRTYVEGGVRSGWLMSRVPASV
jgi:hypothetical protein